MRNKRRLKNALRRPVYVRKARKPLIGAVRVIPSDKRRQHALCSCAGPIALRHRASIVDILRYFGDIGARATRWRVALGRRQSASVG